MYVSLGRKKLDKLTSLDHAVRSNDIQSIQEEDLIKEHKENLQDLLIHSLEHKYTEIALKLTQTIFVRFGKEALESTTYETAFMYTAARNDELVVVKKLVELKVDPYREVMRNTILHDASSNVAEYLVNDVYDQQYLEQEVLISGHSSFYGKEIYELVMSAIVRRFGVAVLDNNICDHLSIPMFDYRLVFPIFLQYADQKNLLLARHFSFMDNYDVLHSLLLLAAEVKDVTSLTEMRSTIYDKWGSYGDSKIHYIQTALSKTIEALNKEVDGKHGGEGAVWTDLQHDQDVRRLRKEVLDVLLARQDIKKIINGIQKPDGTNESILPMIIVIDRLVDIRIGYGWEGNFAIDIIKKLIKAGADVNATSEWKEPGIQCSPLYVARKQGYKNIVKLLVEHGAKDRHIHTDKTFLFTRSKTNPDQDKVPDKNDSLYNRLFFK